MKKINKEIKSKSANEPQATLNEELDDQILQGISAGAVPPKP